MQRPSFDPGLTQQYKGVLKRAINKDGQFNVRRDGATWRDAHPYLYLISVSWAKFFGIIFLTFILTNTLFAFLYVAIGVEHLKGAEAPTETLRFLNAFFFSAHTLTTVGYGNIWPSGPLANITTAVEALTGLMGFAIATGLFFGRFSRPSARIGFSPTAVIAPYKGSTSLQFRIVNRRSNNLIEVEARLLLMTVEDCGGQLQRRFQDLPLERDQVLFFPLTWTIVHPIDEKSPLYGMTAKDMERLQSEIMINLRAFDESFGQVVHVRYSYRYDELVWGAKFAQAFEVDDEGELRLEVGRVGELEPVPLSRPDLLKQKS
jgi:inward rectifier potassium channel